MIWVSLGTLGIPLALLAFTDYDDQLRQSARVFSHLMRRSLSLRLEPTAQVFLGLRGF